MNIFKRNQVVITSLVIMIAIAGYLNFTQNNIPNPDDIVPTDSQNIESALVPNEDSDIEVNNIIDYQQPEKNTSEGNETDETNEGIEVEETSVQSEDYGQSQPGEAIFTSNPLNISDYFISVKIDREQTRSRERETLLSIINSTNLTDEQKEVATNEMINLQKRIEKEAAAEDMLKAKGFNNVYVRMLSDSQRVDVVVSRAEVSDVDRAQIIDVITNITGYPAEEVVITPYNQ
ncbi:stage III sporulation protein AH [Natranaerovirga hydrolytica]|uniref:Stage III sporulation protein AH n=1 Tax=Natranaerovirga hydrolytica TaxID=680378 RepID=A0A4V2Q1P2_9FIRM|nr:SpoIIIAH-like family protein [Natranaerovirga hydrolytica]TCK98361.1 stage III sporulation protein AH [Natranaerovirga hydrolytica]